MSEKMELIIAICSVGYSEIAMDAAKEAGARGGTVTHARGTSSQVAEKRFGVYVTPEKEMILIVVSSKIRDKVLNAIYGAVSQGQPGNCIAFSMPVDNTIGIRYVEETDDKKEAPNEASETNN
ncbi:MAG: P-II family nitrogen regulator [Bacilli bacterium]|nr:P-II family nitrogen regulator [Bacilli bacterium]